MCSPPTSDSGTYRDDPARGNPGGSYGRTRCGSGDRVGLRRGCRGAGRFRIRFPISNPRHPITGAPTCFAHQADQASQADRPRLDGCAGRLGAPSAVAGRQWCVLHHLHRRHRRGGRRLCRGRRRPGRQRPVLLRRPRGLESADSREPGHHVRAGAYPTRQPRGVGLLRRHLATGQPAGQRDRP